MSRTITAQVLTEARRLQAEEGLSIAGAARRLRISPSTLRNYSEGRVCSDCGTPIARPRNSCPATRCQPCEFALRIRWPAERILAAIREWAELYGRPPGAAEWLPALARYKGYTNTDAIFERFYETPGRWPSTNTVIARFGTWSAAIIAAGYEPGIGGRPPRAKVAA